jgi:uncharacterized protein (DUF1800 family)
VVAIDKVDAARLADQAAFGPTPTLVNQISSQGSGWIDAQIKMPATGYAPIGWVNNNSAITCPATLPANNTCYRDNYEAFPIQREFFQNALTGPDQLRQRVALAYSQIFVVSSVQIAGTYALRNYHQMLLDDAFVSYRQLLQDVTLSPAMGFYLNMANNNKGNASGTVVPNENYAREVLQLFSVGTSMLNADGSIQMEGGAPVPTYSQNTILGFSQVFTGWTYQPTPGSPNVSNNQPYFIGAMTPVAANHQSGSKLVLSGVTIPAGGSPESDLKAALDNIANHPNVGPFIGKQMIKFLVTSNPSPAYVSRITAVFNNDGSGNRGNMGAVIKAILMDPEARGDSVSDVSYGHLREPIVDAVSVLRALNAKSDGEYPINITAGEGQSLFGPGSVFSFYPPTYALPGSTTLVGPQFGILNTSSALARLNFINQIVYSANGIGADGSVPGATGTQIDLSAYEAVAANANTMVQLFNTNLLHGSLTPSEASAIVSAVESYAATDTVDRARAAAYLVLASPRYLIVR